VAWNVLTASAPIFLVVSSVVATEVAVGFIPDDAETPLDTAVVRVDALPEPPAAVGTDSLPSTPELSVPEEPLDVDYFLFLLATTLPIVPTTAPTTIIANNITAMRTFFLPSPHYFLVATEGWHCTSPLGGTAFRYDGSLALCGATSG
jgi:hypothetical protein